MFTIAQVEQENLESTQVQLVMLMLRAFLIFGWRVDYDPEKGHTSTYGITLKAKVQAKQ